MPYLILKQDSDLNWKILFLPQKVAFLMFSL